MGFDEPMTRDPLFWAGIVLGAIIGLAGVITQDLSGWNAVWSLICGTATFTWIGTGGIGVVIRGLFRRRRDRKADLDLLLKNPAGLKEVE